MAARLSFLNPSDITGYSIAVMQGNTFVTGKDASPGSDVLIDGLDGGTYTIKATAYRNSDLIAHGENEVFLEDLGEAQVTVEMKHYLAVLKEKDGGQIVPYEYDSTNQRTSFTPVPEVGWLPAGKAINFWLDSDGNRYGAGSAITLSDKILPLNLTAHYRLSTADGFALLDGTAVSGIGYRFYICDHEVTRQEYGMTVSGSYDNSNNDANYPVVSISYYKALAYCNYRSYSEGLTPYYVVKGVTRPDDWGGSIYLEDVSFNSQADGYRLPTSAEWLYAAKGGESYTYAGSDNIDDVAWYKGNSADEGNPSGYKCHEVKKKWPNGYGLYDMCGNVNEMVWSERNSSQSRAAYGGDFSDDDMNFFTLSSLHYSSSSAGQGGNDTGFRVVRNAASSDFVLIQPGTYSMGCDGTGTDRAAAQKPVHEVTIEKPFLICDHEVTQKEYSDHCTFTHDQDYGVGSDYPVQYVSFYQVLYYCNKRSLAEGLTPCYSINGTKNINDWPAIPTADDSVWNNAVCDFDATGYRLPTEEEWEYAARAAFPGTSAILYSGTTNVDLLQYYAWYGESTSSGGKTHPVKSKWPNARGLYDMSGNVYELCWNMAKIPYDATSATEGSRIFRGGDFKDGSDNCAVSWRESFSSYSSTFNLGFRVVRTVN